MRTSLKILSVFIMAFLLMMCKKEEDSIAIPTIKNQTATAITINSAKLSITVNPNGGETTISFYYKSSTESKFTNGSSSTLSGTKEETITFDLNNLNSKTTYSYYFIAKNKGGEFKGEQMNFTTLDNSTNNTNTNTGTTSPVASFSTSINGLSVTFTDKSTNSPTSWSWNFGDGTTSTTQNPNHTYSSAGTYTVTLTVTNKTGSNNTNNSVTIVSEFTYKTSKTTNTTIKTVDGYSFKGVVHITNLVDSETKLNIDSIDYMYEFGAFFGEPTRRGAVRWVGSTGSTLYSIGIECKVMYSNGVETGYYYSYSPSTSSTEGKYGWDISGSPDWAKVFYKSVNVYATKEQTQAIYKAGFYLDSPVITSLNGKTKK